MKELKEFNFFLETWYKLDYELNGINYVRVVDNDKDIREYELYFYADYPIYEEKEKFCLLHKRGGIDKKIKYQVLKNKEIFYCCCSYEELNFESPTILEIEKILENNFFKNDK